MNVEELYQEIIIDHSKHPRNFGDDPRATHRAENFNPLCGDLVKLHLRIANGKIERISFEGEGCAISRASASLLTEQLIGKSIAEARKLVEDLRQTLLEGGNASPALGDAGLLQAVKRFPTRITCALLAWNTLRDALAQVDA